MTHADMAYTHMPFFDGEQLLFCIADGISTWRDSKFAPWTACRGSLEAYEEVGFPLVPLTPFKVHCSPVKHKSRLNISYGGSVFVQTRADEWAHINSAPLWQGFVSDDGITSVVDNEITINGVVSVINAIDRLYRVVPYEDGLLVTGVHDDGTRLTLAIHGRETFRVTVDGENVYKCHIDKGSIWWSTPLNEVSERYRIKTGTNYEMEKIDVGMELKH